MTPVFQTKLTTVDQTTRGNCLAAAVASLVGCPLAEVPAFEEVPSDGRWFHLLCDFLQERGFTCKGSFYVQPGEGDWWPKLLSSSPGVEGFFIVSGPSPRAHVLNGHSTVWHSGVLVHFKEFKTIFNTKLSRALFDVGFYVPRKHLIPILGHENEVVIEVIDAVFGALNRHQG